MKFEVLSSEFWVLGLKFRKPLTSDLELCPVLLAPLFSQVALFALVVKVGI